MLHIYRLTFSRCIVLGESEDAARKTHPTNNFAHWHDDGWRVWDGRRCEFCAEPPPKGWTANLELVHVDRLGSSDSHTLYGSGAEAYQPSEELRARHEGPDESWGGRSLRELGGRYADYVDESTGPLFGGES